MSRVKSSADVLPQVICRRLAWRIREGTGAHWCPALSLGMPGNALTASMPAAVRPHCILCARDLRMLAIVFGLCRWSASFGRLLVVYYRIAQISRLNLACADPLASGDPNRRHCLSVCVCWSLEAYEKIRPKDRTNPILPQVFPNRTFWFHFPFYRWQWFCQSFCQRYDCQR